MSLQMGTLQIHFESHIRLTSDSDEDMRKHPGEIFLALLKFFWQLSEILQMICFEKQPKIRIMFNLGNILQPEALGYIGPKAEVSIV